LILRGKQSGLPLCSCSSTTACRERYFDRLFRSRRSQFLKARIVPERIKHWIEPQQRGSERHVFSQWATARHGKQFLYSGNGAIGFPICAATRARISTGRGPPIASFSTGSAAIARSDRANAAALSPRGRPQDIFSDFRTWRKQATFSGFVLTFRSDCVD
jgi:hypothetical protein